MTAATRGTKHMEQRGIVGMGRISCVSRGGRPLCSFASGSVTRALSDLLPPATFPPLPPAGSSSSPAFPFHGRPLSHVCYFPPSTFPRCPLPLIPSLAVLVNSFSLSWWSRADGGGFFPVDFVHCQGFIEEQADLKINHPLACTSFYLGHQQLWALSHVSRNDSSHSQFSLLD